MCRPMRSGGAGRARSLACAGLALVSAHAARSRARSPRAAGRAPVRGLVFGAWVERAAAERVHAAVLRAAAGLPAATDRTRPLGPRWPGSALSMRGRPHDRLPDHRASPRSRGRMQTCIVRCAPRLGPARCCVLERHAPALQSASASAPGRLELNSSPSASAW